MEHSTQNFKENPNFQVPARSNKILKIKTPKNSGWGKFGLQDVRIGGAAARYPGPLKECLAAAGIHGRRSLVLGAGEEGEDEPEDTSEVLRGYPPPQTIVVNIPG